MLVGDILRRNSRICSKKIGLVDDNKKFSYGEINSRVNRLSNALRASGLEQGSKIAIMADNCHQFVEAYFAIAKAGLVVVPVNARFSAEEASYIINHSDSAAVIVQENLKSVITDLKKSVPKVKHLIAIGKGQQGFQAYEGSPL